MFPHIISALRIAGASLFFVFLGASFVSANSGPGNEDAKLKDFYQYVFGIDTVPTFTNEKIQHAVIEEGAIQSSNILDGSIATDDLATGSVTAGKLNLSGLCASDTILGFDNNGDKTCIAKSTVENNLVIEEDKGLLGTGKSDNKLRIDYSKVQEKLTTPCGENQFLTVLENGVLQCENSADNDAKNEIQDVILSGGLQRDGRNNFGLRDCNVNGQVLKSNGSGVWSCADDVDTNTQLTETEVDAFVSDNGYISTSNIPSLSIDGNVSKKFDTFDPDGDMATWSLIANDGNGNLNSYINSTKGTSPKYETGGSAFRKLYNGGITGQLQYFYAIPGNKGNPITWKNYFRLNPRSEELGLMEEGGKVGIGTDNPSVELEVVGNGKFSGKVTSASTLSTDPAQTLTTKDYVEATISGTPETDPQIEALNLDKITVSADGNLGVGVTNPSSRLELYKPGNRTEVVLQRDTGKSATIKIRTGASGYNWIIGVPQQDLGGIGARFAIGGFRQSKWQPDFVIGSAGNIGLGLTAPTEKLEVAGNGKFSGKVTSSSTLSTDPAQTLTTKDYVDSITPSKDLDRIVIGGASMIFNRDTTADYSAFQMGQESNDRMFVDNSASKNYGGGIWFRVHDASIDSKRRDVLMLTDNGNIGVGTKKPVATLDVNGGIALNINTFSGNKTLTVDNYMALCNANSGAITFTLPDATLSTGVEINVKKKDTTSNACRVVPIGSQLIDGQGEKSITVPYKSFSFISDGANWWIK